jgi:Flp pilus assembly protein TadG
MAINSALKNLVKRFARSQNGNVAIIFGLSAFSLVFAAGAAIDYSRYVSARSHVQAALDAGALAAASAGHGKSEAQRQAIALAAFNANIADGLGAQSGAVATFAINGDKIDASARGSLPSGFIQLAGIDRMNIEVESQVNIPVDKKAEIVLVLDYSGSMKEVSGGAVKYRAMRNAAKKLVSDLEAANPDSVRFGLVPFSHHVWVTLPKQYVVGQTGLGNWTGCTQDRMHPYNQTDATPLPDEDPTKWGHPQAAPPPGDRPHGDCAAYVPNHLVVRPLTNNFFAVKDQLDRMLPYAYTHIALGVEFGFHLLSPNAPFEEGASYSDANTEKIMVVLTDGRQTERAFGPGGRREVSDGERNLEQLCEAVKAKGITMMTIAYDLRDEPTTNRLRNCSTDPGRHFFIAESGGDIASAFESIRNEITAQVALSK